MTASGDATVTGMTLHRCRVVAVADEHVVVSGAAFVAARKRPGYEELLLLLVMLLVLPMILLCRADARRLQQSEPTCRVRDAETMSI